MRHIYIFIFLVPILLYGQKTAQWETKFYFEDAAGNRDTITVGYDLDANNTYNPDFGELDIRDVLWDSVFEVRAGHREAGVIPDVILSKKIIGRNRWEFPDYNCFYGGGVIRIFVKVKYLPLTITWDSTYFNNECHGGDYLAPHAYYDILYNQWFIGNSGEVAPYYCLSKQTNSVLDSVGTEYHLNAQLTIKNADNTLDTLYPLNLYTFPIGHEASPCRDYVAVEEISPDHTDIKVYPNPGQTTVYIGYTDRLRWELTDTQGKKLAIGSDPWLEIGELPQGVYFLNIQIRDRVITKKVVKVD